MLFRAIYTIVSFFNVSEQLVLLFFVRKVDQTPTYLAIFVFLLL
jgi:hypothetical protein